MKSVQVMFVWYLPPLVKLPLLWSISSKIRSYHLEYCKGLDQIGRTTANIHTKLERGNDLSTIRDNISHVLSTMPWTTYFISTTPQLSEKILSKSKRISTVRLITSNAIILSNHFFPKSTMALKCYSKESQSLIQTLSTQHRTNTSFTQQFTG